MTTTVTTALTECTDCFGGSSGFCRHALSGICSSFEDHGARQCPNGLIRCGVSTTQTTTQTSTASTSATTTRPLQVLSEELYFKTDSFTNSQVSCSFLADPVKRQTFHDTLAASIGSMCANDGAPCTARSFNSTCGSIIVALEVEVQGGYPLEAKLRAAVAARAITGNANGVTAIATEMFPRFETLTVLVQSNAPVTLGERAAAAVALLLLDDIAADLGQPRTRFTDESLSPQLRDPSLHMLQFLVTMQTGDDQRAFSVLRGAFENQIATGGVSVLYQSSGTAAAILFQSSLGANATTTMDPTLGSDKSSDDSKVSDSTLYVIIIVVILVSMCCCCAGVVILQRREQEKEISTVINDTQRGNFHRMASVRSVTRDGPSNASWWDKAGSAMDPKSDDEGYIGIANQPVALAARRSFAGMSNRHYYPQNGEGWTKHSPAPGPADSLAARSLTLPHGPAKVQLSPASDAESADEWAVWTTKGTVEVPIASPGSADMHAHGSVHPESPSPDVNRSVSIEPPADLAGGKGKFSPFLTETAVGLRPKQAWKPHKSDSTSWKQSTELSDNPIYRRELRRQSQDNPPADRSDGFDVIAEAIVAASALGDTPSSWAGDHDNDVWETVPRAPGTPPPEHAGPWLPLGHRPTSTGTIENPIYRDTPLDLAPDSV